MVTLTVGVHDPARLTAKVYVPASGAERGFISLDAAEANVHFGGRGRAAVEEARALAASLEQAAEELETALNAQEAAVKEQVASQIFGASAEVEETLKDA